MRGIDATTGAGVAWATKAWGATLASQRFDAGLSLIFAAGDRPAADDLQRLLASESFTGQGARISFIGKDDAGWLELLASGLTFDLTGLSPAAPAPLPPDAHRFGLPADSGGQQYEAVRLSPGPHISGGPAMIPVVRTMAGLAASLALPLPVKAVCWNPSASWMEPGYFARIIVNWLSGGAFPALGLTAIDRAADGSVETVGLAFFAGQELRVEPGAGEVPAQTVKLAVRVIDHVVRHGPIRELSELQGPAGEPLLAEPSRDGRLVRVWRTPG